MYSRKHIFSKNYWIGNLKKALKEEIYKWQQEYKFKLFFNPEVDSYRGDFFVSFALLEFNENKAAEFIFKEFNSNKGTATGNSPLYPNLSIFLNKYYRDEGIVTFSVDIVGTSSTKNMWKDRWDWLDKTVKKTAEKYEIEVIRVSLFNMDLNFFSFTYFLSGLQESDGFIKAIEKEGEKIKNDPGGKISTETSGKILKLPGSIVNNFSCNYNKVDKLPSYTFEFSSLEESKEEKEYKFLSFIHDIIDILPWWGSLLQPYLDATPFEVRSGEFFMNSLSTREGTQFTLEFNLIGWEYIQEFLEEKEKEIIIRYIIDRMEKLKPTSEEEEF